jgi:hypothetical protein
MSGDAAGKIGMLQSGQDALNKSKAILMPNGVIDKESYKILAQASMNLPHTDGRHYNTLIADTIEGKLRLESGAAVPEEEVKRIANRFKPSALDNPATIKDKLDRLEQFNLGTTELLDPNKKYSKNAEKFKTSDGKTYVVTPVTQYGIPESALKTLKEGVIIKFGNGQSWTLENGVPKRIP